MNLQIVIMKVKRTILCGGDDGRKRSLEISSPTNVRKGVLDLPGLTKEEVNQIREKASNDATRLLSLTSHPQIRRSSPPYESNYQPPSVPSSRSQSTTLLNSASSNLPVTLPTPPRRQHGDSDRPIHSSHNRIKGFWGRTRRLSNTLSTYSHSGYQDLSSKSGNNEEGLAMLSLDFKDTEDPDLESSVSINESGSVKSGVEGFESQDMIGGRHVVARSGAERVTDVGKKHTNELISKAARDVNGGESSSEDEGDGVVLEDVVNERKLLVAA